MKTLSAYSSVVAGKADVQRRVIGIHRPFAMALETSVAATAVNVHPGNKGIILPCAVMTKNTGAEGFVIFIGFQLLMAAKTVSGASGYCF